MGTTSDTTTSDASLNPNGIRLYNVLVGAAALTVLLQGLWAGIFLEHDGERDNAAGWIDVHARGGEIAIALALASAAVAFIRIRARRDLWIGSCALTAFLILESYFGGLIRDDSKDSLTSIHVPIAMALMSLSVWLVFQSLRHRRQQSDTLRPSESAVTIGGTPMSRTEHADLLSLNASIGTIDTARTDERRDDVTAAAKAKFEDPTR